MLKKLLKYDLKSVNKVLIVFYILALGGAFTTRLFLGFENSFLLNIIGQICSGFTISMIFSILINNLMRLWVRFRNNFYGDESYLTHTLPIEKKTLYLSKISSAFITLFTSILVITLTLFIAYYSKENFENIKQLLTSITSVFNVSTFSIVFTLLIIIYLEIINMIQIGYTGIILGNKMNNNRIAYSVLFGFVGYTIMQLINLLVLFVIAIFNKEIMNLFFTNELINFNNLKPIVIVTIILYTFYLIFLCLINIRLFKKGVNVD